MYNISVEQYNQLREKEETMKKQKNKMKTVYEYMTVFFAILGTLAMVSAVGSLETNQYLLFAAAVSTGFASFIMSLFSQQLYSEAK
jgi:putative Mn2+ efflux pump MntP